MRLAWCGGMIRCIHGSRNRTLRTILWMRFGAGRSHIIRIPIEADVTGPGRISFWWRASCEPGYDRATVLLSGVEQRSNWSDVKTWIFVQFNVPAGTHVIRWVYEKDGSESEKEDAAWLDEVRFEPTDKIFLEIEPDQYVGHEIWLPATEAQREVLLLTSTNLVTWSTNASVTTNMIRTDFTNHERQFFRAIVRGN